MILSSKCLNPMIESKPNTSGSHRWFENDMGVPRIVKDYNSLFLASKLWNKIFRDETRKGIALAFVARVVEILREEDDGKRLNAPGREEGDLELPPTPKDSATIAEWARYCATCLLFKARTARELIYRTGYWSFPCKPCHTNTSYVTVDQPVTTIYGIDGGCSTHYVKMIKSITSPNSCYNQEMTECQRKMYVISGLKEVEDHGLRHLISFNALSDSWNVRLSPNHWSKQFTFEPVGGSTPPAGEFHHKTLAYVREPLSSTHPMFSCCGSVMPVKDEEARYWKTPGVQTIDA